MKNETGNQQEQEPSQISPALIRMALVRYLGALVALIALFFWPAGTFAYWQAWLYLVVLFIPTGLVGYHLLKHEPGLMAGRMKTREKLTAQGWIVGLSLIPLLLTFFIPGLDRRFGWSHIPPVIVILCDVVALIAYGGIILVFRENRFASRIIEITPGQKVISSGPYAVVRHPMYAVATLMYIVSPVALGSWWAVLPALFIIPVMVARILNEEKFLARELRGYLDYMQKVRYRMLPGIW